MAGLWEFSPSTSAIGSSVIIWLSDRHGKSSLLIRRRSLIVGMGVGMQDEGRGGRNAGKWGGGHRKSGGEEGGYMRISLYGMFHYYKVFLS